MTISDDAMQVLTGMFLSPGASLRMANQVSRLTAPCKDAIDELVSVGLLTVENEPSGAVIYRQTDAGKQHRRQTFAWMNKQTPIRIAEKIE